MLTPHEAELLAEDAMRFFADVAKDAGVYSGEFERLLIDGAFSRWTREQRLEMALFYDSGAADFPKRLSIGTPASNMAQLYIAWLLRNTRDADGTDG